MTHWVQLLEEVELYAVEVQQVGVEPWGEGEEHWEVPLAVEGVVPLLAWEVPPCVEGAEVVVHPLDEAEDHPCVAVVEGVSYGVGVVQAWDVECPYRLYY